MKFSKLHSVILTLAALASVSAIAGTVDFVFQGVTSSAYIGVTAESASWETPTREIVQPFPRSLRWTLPDGEYRAVIASLGCASLWVPTFRVTADSTRQIRFACERVATVVGQVVDKSGAPIPDVEVGMAGQFLHEGRVRLSDKANRYLEPQSVVRTGSNGRFELPVSRNVVPVMFRGGPYAARMVMADVSHKPDLGTVALERGSTVVLKWRNGVPTGKDLRLALLPSDNGSGQANPLHSLAPRIWSGPATSSETRWDNLPRGVYDVLLVPGSRSDMAAPLSLAHVSLDGREREVVLDLALPPKASAPTVLLLDDPRRTIDPSKANVLRWSGDDLRPLKVEGRRAGDMIVIDLPEGVDGERPLIVSTPALIGIAHPDAPVDRFTVRMVASAKIFGSIRVERHRERPIVGTVTSRACGSDEIERYPIAISRAGHAEAIVPAGCREFVVHVPDHVPATLPRAQLKPGEMFDFGRFTLDAGGSILVRLDEPEPGVRVDAYPIADLDRNLPLSAVRPIASAITTPQGWGRLTGVPPVPVRMAFSRPGKPRPVFSEPLEVHAGDTVILDRTRLAVQGDLEVATATAPATYALYSVSLTSDDRFWPRSIPITAAAGKDGRVLVTGLPEGTWHVRANIRPSNGRPVWLSARDVYVTGVTPTALSIPLDDLIFSGRITRSDEGVPATLDFRAAETRTVAGSAVSDHDGRFSVLLPAAGSYQMRVSETGQVAHSQQLVTFGKAGEEVLIQLPAGEVTGEVLDESDRPVAGAALTFTREVDNPASAADQVFTSADDSGHFEVRGLREGLWIATAKKNPKLSQPLPVSIASGARQEHLIIRMSEGREFGGRILSPLGAPEPQASVVVRLPPPALGHMVETCQTQTDEAGRFRCLFSRGEPAVFANIQVLSAAHVVATNRTPLSAEPNISLPAATGEVRLKRPAGWLSVSGGIQRLVAADGSMLGPLFAGVITSETSPNDLIVVKGLSAGNWIYTEPDSPIETHALLSGAGLPRLSIVFTIAPGGSTLVEIKPEAQTQKGGTD